MCIIIRGPENVLPVTTNQVFACVCRKMVTDPIDWHGQCLNFPPAFIHESLLLECASLLEVPLICCRCYPHNWCTIKEYSRFENVICLCTDSVCVYIYIYSLWSYFEVSFTPPQLCASFGKITTLCVLQPKANNVSNKTALSEMVLFNLLLERQI